MRKSLWTLVICFLVFVANNASVNAACAPIQTAPTLKPVAVEQVPVDYKLCSKFFKVDSQKLFYLTLASVNANRYRIDEIQSKAGYVLFTVSNKQFLASVITVDSRTSMLKVTPINNVYLFPVTVIQNMFKYIELNLNLPIEKLTVQ